MSTLASSHITIDDQGVARIDNTRMKVIHVVREMMARGSSPQQLGDAFPELSLAQIYSALAYYHDHKDALDAQIERERREAGASRAQTEETPGRKKLRDRGHLP